MARRCSPRAISTTSCPSRARSAPRYPPTPPAPTSPIFTRVASRPHGSAVPKRRRIRSPCRPPHNRGRRGSGVPEWKQAGSGTEEARMRWEGRRESDNIEDQRGAGGRVMRYGLGGIGGLVLIVVVLLLGGDPRQFLDQGSGAAQGGEPDGSPGPARARDGPRHATPGP